MYIRMYNPGGILNMTKETAIVKGRRMTDTKRLNEIIENSGLKKKNIAESLGLTPQGLYLKLNGKQDFRLGEAIELCRILVINRARDKIDIFFRP